jgi:EmrB/QacA subfamily drug resistance transporter
MRDQRERGATATLDDIGSPPTVNPSAVLAVLCTASFMATLDVFIVNVAFSDIGREFHGTSLANLSWVLNGYTIVYAALLVPLGRIADRYGRKKVFLGGLTVFTIGSAACAASPGLWPLVTCRVAQATGAAALTPTSLGLLLGATPREDRGRAVKIWAATGTLAAAIGPAVGGLLVQANWRWVFIVNVPIGGIAFIASRRIVPDSRDSGVSRVPDVVGAAVIAVSIAALALGLVKGPHWGWASGKELLTFGVAVAAAGLFVQRIRTHESPVVEPVLLKVPTFAWSNLAALAFAAMLAASLLSLILWLQEVWHYSAVRTGFAVAPGALIVAPVTVVAHRLAKHVPVGVVAAAGCAVAGAGNLLLLATVGQQSHYVAELLPGWLLSGVGVGLAFPTIISSATADLPPGRAATGSAVVTMSRQVGLVLGVSILIAVLGSRKGFAASHTAFQHGWAAIALMALAGMFAALRMTPRPAFVAEIVS